MATRTIPDVTTLGETGDLSAEPGTRAWAIAMRLEIAALLHKEEASAGRLAWLTKAMEEHAGYRQLADQHGRPFTSWRAFCEAKAPWGLGYDPAMLTRIINERLSVQERAAQPRMLLDDGPATAEEKTNFDYIKDNNGGTSADYLTARIARDRPDILERMRAGEYPSVRAAALDAGIVRARISIPTDIEGAARALARKFTPEELHRLVELLAERIAVDI